MSEGFKLGMFLVAALAVLAAVTGLACALEAETGGVEDLIVEGAVRHYVGYPDGSGKRWYTVEVRGEGEVRVSRELCLSVGEGRSCRFHVRRAWWGGRIKHLGQIGGPACVQGCGCSKCADACPCVNGGGRCGAGCACVVGVGSRRRVEHGQ